MNLVDYFDIKRFLKICKIEIFNRWKSFFLGTVIISIVFFSTSQLAILTKNKIDAFPFFVIALFIGLISTSKLFSEYHKSEYASQAILVPASSFEKWLSKLVLSYIAYFIFTLILFIAVAAIISLISYAVNGSFYFFNPFYSKMFESIKIFTLFHALFFTGSIFFRRTNFFFTLLIIIGAASIIWTIFFIIALILIKNYSTASSLNELIINISNFFKQQGNIIVIILNIIFFALVPIGLYTWTFFRFRKIEVR